MKKLLLATTIALLVGATASPAFADEHGRRAGGEASVSADPKGAAREEAREDREDRREARQDVREARDDRREARRDLHEARDDRREARHDIRDDRRDPRADYRGDNRQDSRTWTAGESAVRQRPRADVHDVARPTGIARPAQVRSPSPAPVLAQHRDRDYGSDHDRDYGRDYERDHDRDYGRDYDRDHDRDYGRDHDRDYDRDYARDRYRYDRDTYDRNRNYDWRNEWRHDRHDWRDGHRRDGRYYTRYRDARWHGYQWYPQYRYRAPTRYAYPYGYRPYRWSVGYRMPYGYYNSPSYILDWRYYRLPMPPIGYEWVRVDRDVVLVHMFSGYIRDVLYGLFY